MTRLAPLLALMLLAAHPAAAQEESQLAPQAALRPEQRPAPEPPARPATRPDEAEAPVSAMRAAIPLAALADDQRRAAQAAAAEQPAPAAEAAPANPAIDPALIAEVPVPAPAQLAAEAEFFDEPAAEDLAHGVANAPYQRRETFFAPTGDLAPAPQLSPAPAPAARADDAPLVTLVPAPVAEPPQNPVLEELALRAPGLEEVPFGPHQRPEPREQPMASAPGRPELRPERALAAVPLPDPEMPAELPNGEPAPAMPELSALAVAKAYRPPERPAEITRVALEQRALRERGAVCGNVDIQGDRLGNVPGPGSCGVTDAVQVRSVGGIRLSYPATMDCRTAETLNAWVQRVAIPTLSGRGGGLAGLSIMGDYSCRGRNGDPSARLSEHAFGHAIDIGGFTLRDGTSISVLRNWGGSSFGSELRALHSNACGIFGTVLGPTANAAHRDHFHFDTARYRSGSYCR
ncbi:extensin-like domain-containing protein [Pseudoroseicyclus sp. H15]